MSEINRSVYPDGSTYGDSMLVSSNKLNVFVDGNPWEQSIAVAQSMSDFAPFNNVDYFSPPLMSGSPYFNVKNVKKQVQKIGLVYISTGETFGNNQYYVSGVQGIDFSDVSHIYYTYASLRKTGRTSLVQEIQRHYNPQNYEIVTGIDLQHVLGVVCVGYSDNTYSSLKYYNDNKQNITATPVSLFMLMFYGDTSISNVRRCLAPIELEKMRNEFWRYQAGTPPTLTTDYFEGSFAFPMAITRTINPLIQGHSLYKAQTVPSLIFPLIGCCAGSGQFSRSWSTASAMSTTQGTPIYGGGYEHYYTIAAIGNQYYPVLAQAAFDDALKVAATYGLPFTIDFPTDAHTLYTSPITTYIPIANDGGYYDGRFETLTVNGEVSPELSPANYSQWTGGINAPYDGRSYDPTIPIPAEEIDLTEPSFTPIGAFNKTYILNKDGVDGIQDFIYGADDSVIQNLLDGLKTFGTNPMNAFLSLHMYPFEVRQFTGAATTARVVCGRVPISPQSGDVIGYLLPTDAKAVVDLGNFKIDPQFDCFLDYEPYTTIQLYIPFIGSVDLPPSLYMGKRVHVKIVCDWITAAATAIVYADGIPLIYQSGIIGVSIAMTGDNHAKTASDVLSGIVGAAGSAAQAVGGAMALNPVQAGTGVTDTLKNLLSAQAAYTKTEFMQAGSASPMCAFYLPDKCYITISRPRIGIDREERSQYNIINGFSMNRTATINDLISGGELAGGTGFIQAAPSVIPMKQYLGGITDGEYEELIQILAHGFRIDPL